MAVQVPAAGVACIDRLHMQHPASAGRWIAANLGFDVCEAVSHVRIPKAPRITLFSGDLGIIDDQRGGRKSPDGGSFVDISQIRIVMIITSRIIVRYSAIQTPTQMMQLPKRARRYM